MYYIGSMQCDPNYLEHYGKKGMHWGERKYQNPDGTLTAEGREHYGVGERQETRGRDIYEKQQIRRMNRAYNKVSRLDRRIIGEGTARQNRKLEKARNKYAEAQGNLDKYHNSSAEEQKKARNSIRLRRAAAAASVIAAGLATYGGIKLANMKFDDNLRNIVDNYNKERERINNTDYNKSIIGRVYSARTGVKQPDVLNYKLRGQAHEANLARAISAHDANYARRDLMRKLAVAGGIAGAGAGMVGSLGFQRNPKNNKKRSR